MNYKFTSLKQSALNSLARNDLFVSYLEKLNVTLKTIIPIDVLIIAVTTYIKTKYNEINNVPSTNKASIENIEKSLKKFSNKIVEEIDKIVDSK